MWAVDAIKYNDKYSRELDSGIYGEWADKWAPDMRRAAFQCRTHGTPFFDTMSIVFQESVAQRRSEIQPGFYREKDGSVSPFFERLPRESVHSEGLHIFDIDDPQLVEMDEERIHERLTSHLADLIKGPESEYPDLEALRAAMKYVKTLAVNELDHGFAPGGLIMEMVRQALGLPYEWWGARIDD